MDAETRSSPIAINAYPNGVRQILLCDPAGRNALDEVLRTQLRHALTALLDDDDVRAIAIGADRKNFSVGGDLGQIAGFEPGQASHARMDAANEVAALIGGSPKPIVAAVTGHCLGAGAGLALLCDTIVMGRSASIGFPFLKIGLVADFGISHTLALRIGPAAARQAILYARTFSAPEAERVGLADKVTADDEVHGHALELAGQLAALPAYALALTKQMFRENAGSLDSALQREALNQAICLGSADTREGVAAFKEKRRADFVRAARV
jgi:2-(1,2-epoxy-1,2-dihydrophenyl)acetyl-CoA isomerase